MNKNKLEELIEHHTHAKQEAWSLANELFNTNDSKLTTEEKRALEEAKLSMQSEYSWRSLFLQDLISLRK